MLRDYPEIRKIAYIVSFIVGGLLGAIQVGFFAAQAGQPVWLTVALAVYSFIGGYVGIQAVTNTPSSINTNSGDSEDAQ